MFRSLCWSLLIFCLAFTSGPLQAADFDFDKCPTVVIPADQPYGQFDQDFDDNFEAKCPTVVIPKDQPNVEFEKDFADDFDSDFAAGSSVDEILIPDPLENFNRGVFWVNDKLYFYAIKPVARGYRLILPRAARVSVGNFFSNLATPVRATNALLQLKFNDFANEIYRLIVNTTIGVGGLFDPAASVGGVKKNVEDFGQTLGFYGARHGFYLVLPVIGPSSLRDAVGGLADAYLDPLLYTNMNDWEYLGVKAYKVLNNLSLDRDTYEGIVRDSIDPYLFVRASYAQRRVNQVGKTDYDILMIDGSLFDTDNLNPFQWLGE